MGEVVGVAGVPAATDGLPLHHRVTGLHQHAIVRQMTVQPMRAVVVADHEKVVETRRADLTIEVRRLDVNDDACVRGKKLGPDGHVEVVGVPLASPMPVSGC